MSHLRNSPPLHYSGGNFNVDSNIRNTPSNRVEMAHFEAPPENALFTNALSGIILEAELRAPISHSPLSPNAFRKLRCRIRDDARRKEPSQKMQSAFIANRIQSSRIREYFSNTIVSDWNSCLYRKNLIDV